MRLRRLELIRYGHLSDVALDFPEGVALHVVLGANEAGKSTALAAIADALFGFGARSDYDFMHTGPQLRVGFTLAAPDGAETSFIRRKGRANTLLDAATEQVLPEEALRRFLGGAGREVFRSGFGLNGAQLRKGGQELLLSQGDAGESLLAGIGLPNVRAALNQLEERARALVGDGRGRRLLSEAVATWKQSQQDSDTSSVTSGAWKDADERLTDAVTALAGVRERERALATEGSRLERVRRVLPLLRLQDAARAELAAVADAPAFPADAAERLARLLAARHEAARDGERTAEALGRLADARAGLPADAAALAAQDEIDLLTDARPVASQASRDLPKMYTSIAGARARVAGALDDLGLALTPEAARDAVPAALARRGVQELIRAHAALMATREAAAAALAASRQAHDRAGDVMRRSVTPADPALFRRTVEAVRGEGRLDAERVAAARGHADATAAANAAHSALPLWTGDMAALVACPVPLAADCEAVAARMGEAEAGLLAARADAQAMAREMREIEDDLSRLASGETMPTREAVASARDARDQAWQGIRHAHEHDAEATPARVATALAATFERLRDAADQLADRRADEAQRVAEFLAARARLGLLHTRQDAVAAALVQAEAAAGDAASAWTVLWAPTSLRPGAPAAMAEWQRMRAEVLRLAETQTRALAKHDGIAAAHDAARAALTPFVPPVAPSETLAAMLLRAETACSLDEAAMAAHRERLAALTRERERLPALAEALERADMALLDWRSAWSAAMPALGLPAAASVAVAENGLAAWARIAEVAPAWREDDRRLVDMTACIERHEHAARALSHRLGEAASEEAAPLVAARLARRLAAAREAAADATKLAARVVEHEAAVADATAHLHAAEAALAAMRRFAAVANNDELQASIARAEARDAAAAAIRAHGDALLAHGDGHAEDALRAEALPVDADSLPARVAEIAAAQAALGAERERLSATRTRVEAELAAMRAGRDAAGRAQEAADALAAARGHAESYARLHVARELLRAGIERFREQQQGPLLRAAGAHFTRLTAGRYVRLVADQDAGGRAVLHAVRDIGTECPVEALSEGTRDQLYLALRLAAIEAHVTAAEPLPLIADDLLAHFDDARAAAAIASLAVLGRTTQVILFTHHDHIAGLAARQAGVAVQRLASPSPADAWQPVLAVS